MHGATFTVMEPIFVLFAKVVSDRLAASGLPDSAKNISPSELGADAVFAVSSEV